ncbi:hypothetical protein PR048_023751 [Dryococelus australis]|uniref:Uncharacterized protein n=1 Tax=Dryococelus australis TaxID=614101 RepID=A0ABQ9GUX5_9NEOP|nr:hypothetical protein PR048_023751 [Dryococelus australis]
MRMLMEQRRNARTGDPRENPARPVASSCKRSRWGSELCPPWREAIALASESLRTLPRYSRRGHFRTFACGISAGRCRCSASFLGDLPFPQPFKSGNNPPSSALNTSFLRAKSLHSSARMYSNTSIIADHVALTAVLAWGRSVLGTRAEHNNRVYLRAGRCRWSAGFLRDFLFPPTLAFRRCSTLASLHPHRLSRPRFQTSRPNLFKQLITVSHISMTVSHYILCDKGLTVTNRGTCLSPKEVGVMRYSPVLLAGRGASNSTPSPPPPFFFTTYYDPTPPFIIKRVLALEHACKHPGAIVTHLLPIIPNSRLLINWPTPPRLAVSTTFAERGGFNLFLAFTRPTRLTPATTGLRLLHVAGCSPNKLILFVSLSPHIRFPKLVPELRRVFGCATENRARLALIAVDLCTLTSPPVAIDPPLAHTMLRLLQRSGPRLVGGHAAWRRHTPLMTQRARPGGGGGWPRSERDLRRRCGVTAWDVPRRHEVVVFGFACFPLLFPKISIWKGGGDTPASHIPPPPSAPSRPARRSAPRTILLSPALPNRPPPAHVHSEREAENVRDCCVRAA